MVISQTPCDALEREWAEHELAKFVKVIAGQEIGTKTEHLQFATAGKYPADKVLMIGDAPGDHKAARPTASVYPVLPGGEEGAGNSSHEALERFFPAPTPVTMRRSCSPSSSLPTRAPKLVDS
ncbi:MAG: hypothetical protein Ct9H300mP7_4720 [Verrucomicrobiota bacterium]|nr:MAG: hypothetical protein Ct9H300mP7_4720 [Verrucomicrobiota bacterium]